MPFHKSQLEAIRFGEGPALILAGPGSGKTTVITHRVRTLIAERGVDPSRILVITFTKAAADEMKERFLRLIGEDTTTVSFGTFHAVFFKILKIAYHYNGSHILRPEKKQELMRQVLAEVRPQVEDEAEFLSEISNEISRVKGDRIDLEHYYSNHCPEDVFQAIYRGYERKLREAGLIDFDDMLRLCDELLRARPDILAVWQKKYQYILIDEFQDINRIQYEVIRMLAAPENNLFIVGDDDQSIYRFRGAKPEIMLGFPKDYPAAKRILLSVNYRSRPEIVQAASQLVMHNETRFLKQLSAAASPGGKLIGKAFCNPAEEGRSVVKELQDYHRQGIPYEEMALLFRTNQNPRGIVEQLLRMNLPFSMRDVVPNLYEHWISGDILTYLLIAHGSRRRGDFLRIINRPKRYVHRAAFQEPEVDMQQLKKYYQSKDWMIDKLERLEYDLSAIGKMTPFAAITYLRKSVGYEDYLKEYAEYRRMQPEEIFDVLDELQEASRPFRNLQEWMGHIRDYTRELKEQKTERKNSGGIAVSTMHSAKGLEYQVVYILDANEGITPYKKTAGKADLEEERRLFYVAATRAKQYLHVYWTKEHYHKELPASRFVTELFGSKAVRLAEGGGGNRSGAGSGFEESRKL
ncbi:ATP-dependent helicase [Hominifimenecus sp. rT4P-3]|uniref:ATP-dependent helicase n=1 Tax=Hominifimenecus sp. rT4P-3 TaxID=3242979 RepID=UPI003DA54F1D